MLPEIQSKNRLMLDLESLGVCSNPVIAAIGAVVFNFESKSIIDEFYITIDCSDAEAHGLVIDASTVLFWLKQSRSVIDDTFFNKEKVSLPNALLALNNFYLKNNCEEIYGNGALTDLLWINSAYQACNTKQAWNFRAERCYRTLVKNLPKVIIAPNPTKHHALADARWQAEYLLELSKIINFR